MPQESLNLPYVLLTGVVILAIIIAFLIYKPQITTWQNTRAEIVDLKQRVMEKEQFLATIDQKSAQLRSNAAYEQELTIVLPATESVADVLRIIDRQAGTAAVRIAGVSNTSASNQTAVRVSQALGEETKVPDTLVTHGADVKVEGSYQQIRQFLSLMENAIRFMDVPKIVVSAGNQPDLLQATISTQFYSLSANQ